MGRASLRLQEVLWISFVGLRERIAATMELARHCADRATSDKLRVGVETQRSLQANNEWTAWMT